MEKAKLRGHRTDQWLPGTGSWVWRDLLQRQTRTSVQREHDETVLYLMVVVALPCV